MSEKDLSELQQEDKTGAGAVREERLGQVSSLEQRQKPVMAEGQTVSPKTEAGSPEPSPLSASAEKEEDDNISWEDAFKEEEAANAGAKTSASGQDRDSGRSGSASGASGNLGNLDIDMDDIKPSENKKSASAAVTPKKPVKKLEFATFNESDKTTEPPKNLDFILDIPLTISVELGRTKMVINDMLQLGQGSVVELAKLAGEPLDIYVNGKLMAKGEVVLVNDKFGVRLTDIISPVERVKKL